MIVRVFRAIYTNINKCSFGLVPLLGTMVGLVVEELDRLGVIVEALEEIGKEGLVMGEDFHVMLVKVDPYLHSVEGLQRFRGNKPEAVDVLAMIEVFSKQKQHQVSIDLVFILLSFID